MKNIDENVVIVYRREGKFDPSAPDRDMCRIILVLPHDAPISAVMGLWALSDAPGEDLPPSVVLKMMLSGANGCRTNLTDQQISRLSSWLSQNDNNIDYFWVQKSLQTLEEQIADEQEKINNLMGLVRYCQSI